MPDFSSASLFVQAEHIAVPVIMVVENRKYRVVIEEGWMNLRDLSGRGRRAELSEAQDVVRG
ncbi:hypothetical protein KIN20_025162 [Parelaphostrongylus tenuis]|uniref:Uncharacterized protein n=1 Tax=Parelaphostrongylus tenuis TaxID=148309 RepID=A0AAD5QU82_PARTN|nr:hypothetical protein KIN20_025162 [Parelaphostrongylus tenuis]